MQDISRRDLFGFSMAAAGAAAVLPEIALAQKGSGPKGGGMTGSAAKGSGAKVVMEYTLPDLPYAYDALEPYLDKTTLTIHHDKHHAGYVKGLNKTLSLIEEAIEAGDMSRIQALSRALAFHGAGHVMHTLYWGNLSPKPSSPTGSLKQAIDAQFGSVETCWKVLRKASKKVAGSGWGMLAYEPFAGRLLVLQIEKHENQVIPGAVPLLVIDVWEHAYYVKYQNRRGDYLDAVSKIIDWKEVGARFERAVKATGPY